MKIQKKNPQLKFSEASDGADPDCGEAPHIKKIFFHGEDLLHTAISLKSLLTPR